MIVDMTPCAPDGGPILSNRDCGHRRGDVDVASCDQTPWRKITATLGPDSFTAVASFGEGLDADLFKGPYDMTIALDRTTGSGAYASGTAGKVRFQCDVKTRQF